MFVYCQGDIGNFSTKWKQKGDWEWLLRALHCGWGVLYIPKTLFIYTQTEANLSSSAFKNDVDLRESAEIFRRFIAEVRILDIFQFYFMHDYFALRRLIRAITRRDVAKFSKTLQTLMLLIQSMLWMSIAKIFVRFRLLIPTFFQEILRCPLYVWKARSLAFLAVNEKRLEVLFDFVRASRFSPIQIKSEILALDSVIECSLTILASLAI